MASELCTGAISDGQEATNPSTESTPFEEFKPSVHAAWEDVEVVIEVGGGGHGRIGGGAAGNGGGATEGIW